jgi:hypothetical protein
MLPRSGRRGLLAHQERAGHRQQRERERGLSNRVPSAVECPQKTHTTRVDK